MPLKGEFDRDAGVEQATPGLRAHEGDVGQAAVGLARAVDADGGTLHPPTRGIRVLWFARREGQLESPGGDGIFNGMSTVAEIERAMEKLAPAQWAEIRRWMDRRSPHPIGTVSSARQMPDFLARQKAVFGERVLEDSQGVLDDFRADRR